MAFTLACNNYIFGTSHFSDECYRNLKIKAQHHKNDLLKEVIYVGTFHKSINHPLAYNTCIYNNMLINAYNAL